MVEKDAVFIPAGWDNDKKIAILYENMHRYGSGSDLDCHASIISAVTKVCVLLSVRPDQYYTDVIARPMSVLGRRSGVQGSGGQAGSGGSQVREVEVVAEEEQSFLSRQQQYLAQGLPPSQGQVSAPSNLTSIITSCHYRQCPRVSRRLQIGKWSAVLASKDHRKR